MDVHTMAVLPTPHLLALPVNLSFPLARLLTADTAFGPESLTFTP